MRSVLSVISVLFCLSFSPHFHSYFYRVHAFVPESLVLVKKMAKIKRKSVVPASNPKPIQPDDDDSGSDYEVDRHMTLTKVPKPVAEEFPLPKQVRKELVKRTAKVSESEESSEEEEDDDDVNLPTLTKGQIADILQTIKNNKRLVLNVSNVNFSTSKEEIEEHFRKAGRVKSVRIPKKRASGFAFVEMLDAEGFQVRRFNDVLGKNILTCFHCRKLSCCTGPTWMVARSGFNCRRVARRNPIRKSYS